MKDMRILFLYWNVLVKEVIDLGVCLIGCFFNVELNIGQSNKCSCSIDKIKYGFKICCVVKVWIGKDYNLYGKEKYVDGSISDFVLVVVNCYFRCNCVV